MTAGLVPPGADVRTVDTRAGTLRLLHAGDPGARTPVVLVHGGGSDAASVSWYRAMAPLAADREVWAVDLPGFGGSIDRTPVGGASSLAEVVAEVVAATCRRPPVVVGVSMGGDVVLTLGLDHSADLRAVVAIAPGGLTSRFRGRVAHAFAWWASRLPDAILLPLGRLANLFARSAVRAMVTEPDALPPEVVDEFVRLARHPRGALGYTRYNQASIGRDRMTNDLSGRIHELTLPTLFFHGAEDPLVDPQDSLRAAARMPHARAVIPPGCGHWAQLEAHDAFLAEMRVFLDEVDRP